MELKDTVELMLSEDYKDRFKAEVYQTEIRYWKLRNLVEDYEKGKLKFKPHCSLKLLKDQLFDMECYLADLSNRADKEGIELEEVV